LEGHRDAEDDRKAEAERGNTVHYPQEIGFGPAFGIAEEIVSAHLK
jgi:hypothetical protein